MPDANQIRETAIEVLNRPDYNLHSTENFRRVIERIFEWVGNFVKPIFDFIDFLYVEAPILWFLMMFILVAILVALVVHIVYSFRTAMGRRKEISNYDTDEDISLLLPETWEKRARQAYAEQDYLTAVRYLLHAGLLSLELARKSKLRRGATNREYLRRYRGTNAFDPLALLVEITDSRWFGDIECTREDVEQCIEAHNHIRRISSVGVTDVHSA